MSGFATLDWIVIVSYFLAIGGLAIWVITRKQKDTEDYFLAGRNIGWFVVGASIFASNIGSEHVVGLAGAGAGATRKMACASDRTSNHLTHARVIDCAISQGGEAGPNRVLSVSFSGPLRP